MFFAKKLLDALLAPGTLILILLGCGLLRLMWSHTSKRSGWVCLFLGTLCFYLFSTAPLPALLVCHLEKQYPPLVQVQDLPEINYIVVLSSNHRRNLSVPPTSQLNEPSAFRVIEGIRLFHALRGRPALIMSGGNNCGEIMVAFARSLGVPAEKLIAETRSMDTYGNAREVKSLVHDAPFLLVTSGTHLPRSMKIFRLLGMNPVPAPADLRCPAAGSLHAWFPAGEHLADMYAAVHEYLGLTYLAFFPGRAGK